MLHNKVGERTFDIEKQTSANTTVFSMLDPSRIWKLLCFPYEGNTGIWTVL